MLINCTSGVGKEEGNIILVCGIVVFNIPALVLSQTHMPTYVSFTVHFSVELSELLTTGRERLSQSHLN